MSSEIRYSVFRIMLSPLMIFTNFYKIPLEFIDFGDCVEIPQNFFIELELDFVKNKVSNSFLSIEALLKKDKYFAKKFHFFSPNSTFNNDKNIYTIVDEDDEKNGNDQVIEKNENQKIEALLNNSNDDESDEFDDSEDEDYFKKLEEKADDFEED